MATLEVNKNFRLASIAPDYPGPCEKLPEPLYYDDSPPLIGSIEYELNKITDDAVQRVTEANPTFGPIVNVLDYNCSQAAASHMLVKQALALKKYSDEVILKPNATSKTT